MRKYLKREPILGWIKNPNKSFKGDSLFWKSIVQTFLVVGDILAWKVGNMILCLIGRGNIMGFGQRVNLLVELVKHLNSIGMTTI